MQGPLLTPSQRIRFVTLFAGITACAITCSAQHNAYTWKQIHDLFLRTNPMLHAQEQSIDSNRAGEVTAALRPNPTFQNDTTSATFGIY